MLNSVTYTNPTVSTNPNGGAAPLWSEPLALFGEFSHLSGPSVIFTFECQGDTLRSASATVGTRKTPAMLPPSALVQGVGSEIRGALGGGFISRAPSGGIGLNEHHLAQLARQARSRSNSASPAVGNSTAAAYNKNSTANNTTSGARVASPAASPRGGGGGAASGAVSRTASGVTPAEHLASQPTHTENLYRVASTANSTANSHSGAPSPPQSGANATIVQNLGGSGSATVGAGPAAGVATAVIASATVTAESAKLLAGLANHNDFHSRSLSRPLMMVTAPTSSCGPTTSLLPNASTTMDWVRPTQTVVSSAVHGSSSSPSASPPTSGGAGGSNSKTPGGHLHNIPTVGGALTCTQLVCSDMLFGKNIVSGSNLRKDVAEQLFAVVQRTTNSGCADIISIFTDPVIGGVASLSFNLFDVEARGEKRPMILIVTHPDPRELAARMTLLAPYLTALVVDIVAKSDQIRQAELANCGATSSAAKKKDSNQRELRVTGFTGLLRTLQRELHDFFDIVLPATLSADSMGMLTTLMQKSRLQQEKRETKRLKLAAAKVAEVKAREAAAAAAAAALAMGGDGSSASGVSQTTSGRETVHTHASTVTPANNLILNPNDRASYLNDPTLFNTSDPTPIPTRMLMERAITSVIKPPFITRTDPQVFRSCPSVFLDMSGVAPPEEGGGGGAGNNAAAVANAAAMASTTNGAIAAAPPVGGSSTTFVSGGVGGVTSPLSNAAAGGPTSTTTTTAAGPTVLAPEDMPIPRPPLEDQDLFIETLQAEIDMLTPATAVTFRLKAPKRVHHHYHNSTTSNNNSYHHQHYHNQHQNHPHNTSTHYSDYGGGGANHNYPLGMGGGGLGAGGSSSAARSRADMSHDDASAGASMMLRDGGDAADHNSHQQNTVGDLVGAGGSPHSPMDAAAAAASADHMNVLLVAPTPPISPSIISTRRNSVASTAVAPLFGPQSVLPLKSDEAYAAPSTELEEFVGGGGGGNGCTTTTTAGGAMIVAVTATAGGGGLATSPPTAAAAGVGAGAAASPPTRTNFTAVHMSNPAASRALYHRFPCANVPQPKPLSANPNDYTPMHLLHRERRTRCVVVEVDVPPPVSSGATSGASKSVHGNGGADGSVVVGTSASVSAAASPHSPPSPPSRVSSSTALVTTTTTAATGAAAAVRIPHPAHCAILRNRMREMRFVPQVPVRPLAAWMLDAFWLLRDNLYAFRTSFAPIITAVLSGGKVIVAGERGDGQQQNGGINSGSGNNGGSGNAGANGQPSAANSGVANGPEHVPYTSQELSAFEICSASFALSLANLLPQHLQKTQLMCDEDDIAASSAKIQSLSGDFMRDNIIVQTSILSCNKQFVLSQMQPDGIVYVTVKPGHDVEYWADADAADDEDEEEDGDRRSDEDGEGGDGITRTKDRRQQQGDSGNSITTMGFPSAATAASNKPKPPLIRFPPCVGNVTNVDELYYKENPQETYQKKALNEQAFATAWRHHAVASRDNYPVERRNAASAAGGGVGGGAVGGASSRSVNNKQHLGAGLSPAASYHTGGGAAGASNTMMSDAEFLTTSRWRTQAPRPSTFRFNSTKDADTRTGQPSWMLRNSLEVMEAYGRKVYPTVVVDMIEKTIQLGSLVEQSIKGRQRRLYTAIQEERVAQRAARKEAAVAAAGTAGPASPPMSRQHTTAYAGLNNDTNGTAAANNADDDDDEDPSLTLQEDVQFVQLAGITDLSALIDPTTEQCRKHDINTVRAHYDHQEYTLRLRQQRLKEAKARAEQEKRDREAALVKGKSAVVKRARGGPKGDGAAAAGNNTGASPNASPAANGAAVSSTSEHPAAGASASGVISANNNNNNTTTINTLTPCGFATGFGGVNTTATATNNPNQFAPNEVYMLQLGLESAVREGVSRGRVYLEIYGNLQYDLIATLEKGMLPASHQSHMMSGVGGGGGGVGVGAGGAGGVMGGASDRHHHHLGGGGGDLGMPSMRRGGGGGPSGLVSGGGGADKDGLPTSAMNGGSKRHHHHSRSQSGIGGSRLDFPAGGGGGGSAADHGGAAAALSMLVVMPDAGPTVGGPSGSSRDGGAAKAALIAAAAAGGGGGVGGGHHHHGANSNAFGGVYRNVSIIDAARVVEAFSNTGSILADPAKARLIAAGGSVLATAGGGAGGVGGSNGGSGGGSKSILSKLPVFGSLFRKGPSSSSANAIGVDGAAGNAAAGGSANGGGNGSGGANATGAVGGASKKNASKDDADQQRGNGEGFEFIRKEIQSHPRLRTIMKKWRYGIADDEVLCFLGSVPSPFV